ncbi:MAG: LLM class flavin-dependent oxidoreductase [Luteolibacter sp.]
MKHYSVLDLAPVCEGGDETQAFANSLELAKFVEGEGYHRYWLAEHHNMIGIASAATSVVIGYIAGGTEKIRVGSGGVMLPNHAPLVIAEQFGTLAAMYPGRIDLGLGRAPGGDPKAAAALRRGLGSGGDTFPQDVQELQSYLGDGAGSTGVTAVPGMGSHVPLYLLGSSDFSARLAAELGLPFAFASHFAPEYLLRALSLYRENYQPSGENPEPHVIVAANVFAAQSDAQGYRLFTSLQQQFLGMVRGNRGKLKPAIEPEDLSMSRAEAAQLNKMMSCSLVGSRDSIVEGLESLLRATGADEIIAASQIYDPAARQESFGIFAEVAKGFLGTQR